jgi:phosphohistidine phosphatase SixA
MLSRRHVLSCSALGWGMFGPGLLGLSTPAHAQDPIATQIRAGGVVVAMRHALAPGTFDPPGFSLADCATQRNLSDEGRAQARRIGLWFAQQQLTPSRLRSSPWCRCVDTAKLAFGEARKVEVWDALSSPVGRSADASANPIQALRQALLAATTRKGQFEVWVTHMFVLNDLAQQTTQSGEALVLRTGSGGSVQTVARLLLP